MVSNWRAGVSQLIGHATESVPNARTTQSRASEFRMNCMTRVFSFSVASVSKPGMSVKVRLAKVTFFGLKIRVSSSTRASWTGAVAVTPSLRRTVGSSFVPVSREKMVVFPDADRPNTPIITLWSLAFRFSCWSPRLPGAGRGCRSLEETPHGHWRLGTRGEAGGGFRRAT